MWSILFCFYGYNFFCSPVTWVTVSKFLGHITGGSWGVAGTSSVWTELCSGSLQSLQKYKEDFTRLSLAHCFSDYWVRLGHSNWSELSHPGSGEEKGLGLLRPCNVSFPQQKTSRTRHSWTGGPERQNQHTSTTVIFVAVGSWSIKWVPF